MPPIEPVPANPARVRGPPDGLKLSFNPADAPWKAEDEIIEEFPFDDERSRQFYREYNEMHICCEEPGIWGCLFPPAGIFCYHKYLEYFCADVNAADFAYSRWLAVSRDNIYIVRRKRKSQLRCDCCDVPEIRKTIPINNVQDIMILEPAAYAVCGCCVPNVLSTAQVETAGFGHGDPSAAHGDSSLGRLEGLVDPQRFRNVVMNLKKGVYLTPSGEAQPIGAPPSVDSLGRTLGMPGLPAVGASIGTASSATLGIGSGSDKVEAYLAAMLTTLKSIDEKLSCVTISPSSA